MPTVYKTCIDRSSIDQWPKSNLLSQRRPAQLREVNAQQNAPPTTSAMGKRTLTTASTKWTLIDEGPRNPLPKMRILRMRCDQHLSHWRKKRILLQTTSLSGPLRAEGRQLWAGAHIQSVHPLQRRPFLLEESFPLPGGSGHPRPRCRQSEKTTLLKRRLEKPMTTNCEEIVLVLEERRVSYVFASTLDTRQSRWN